MKPASHRHVFAAVAGFFGTATLVLTAVADTIYFDDFNDQQNRNSGGSYTQTLAGSAPTTRNASSGGSASAVWLAGVEAGGWGQRSYANNGVATPTSSNFLAFTPDAGRIYKVEATIDTTPLGGADPGGTNSWFAIGFTSSQHHWNGVDASTIDVANLVRWNSNKVAALSYTVSGATLAAGGVQYVGWITDRPGIVNLNSASQIKIDNFKLTSGVANPTITYDGNGSDGGSVPVDPSSPLTFGATATTVSVGSMTRSGFNFVGWNTAADGSGTDYSPSSTFTIYDNTTLYAKWIPVGSYTLTYNGNGSTAGTVPTDSSSPYNGGSSVSVIGNTGSLSKTSYSFSGWNTAANGSGTNYDTADTFNINANTTLYARWSPGPNFVWNNQAATGKWSTSDANWYGASWVNSASNNATFTNINGTVTLTEDIEASNLSFGAGDGASHVLTMTGSDLSLGSLNVWGGYNLAAGNAGVDSIGQAYAQRLHFDNMTVDISGSAAVGRGMLYLNNATINVAGKIMSNNAWNVFRADNSTVTTAVGIDYSNIASAVDLRGGTVTTPYIKVGNAAWSYWDTGLYLQGGVTLVASGSTSDFIQVYTSGDTNSRAYASIGTGGATLDTVSYAVTVATQLSGSGGITKKGSGTLTLSAANVYTGNTTVDAGSLVLADNAQLRFVVTDAPSSNKVTGAGSATFDGDFSIDTSAVSGASGRSWTLVDRASLTGESFGSTFSVVGFADPENDGVWTKSDSKGNWSFNEATGVLTLSIATDYDTWKAANGVTGGSSADDDNDGLTNFAEYAYGLNPTSSASANPIAVPLDKTTGKFRYTRRATPATTGLSYTVWISEDLVNWSQDTAATASQTVTGTVGEVETVEATISGTLPLAQPNLFMQVRVK